MAAKIPPTVVIDQGRDFFLTVTYALNGTPIDLTGYTAVFSLGQSFTDTLNLNLTTGSGITINGPLGQVTVHATATQTDLLQGTYTAELVIISGGGVETSLLKGTIEVIAKVAA